MKIPQFFYHFTNQLIPYFLINQPFNKSRIFLYHPHQNSTAYKKIKPAENLLVFIILICIQNLSQSLSSCSLFSFKFLFLTTLFNQNFILIHYFIRNSNQVRNPIYIFMLCRTRSTNSV